MAFTQGGSTPTGQARPALHRTHGPRASPECELGPSPLLGRSERRVSV